MAHKNLERFRGDWSIADALQAHRVEQGMSDFELSYLDECGEVLNLNEAAFRKAIDSVISGTLSGKYTKDLGEL